MAGATITQTNHDQLFKTFYVPASDAAIHTATPYLTALSRQNNFVGKEIQGVVPLSIGGGVGNYVIPRSSTRKYGEVKYSAVAMWCNSALDWEAVVASENDAGAFLRVTQAQVENDMEAFTDNWERQLFGYHTGGLGTIIATAPVDNTGGSYTFTVSTATWFAARWRVGDIVNFDTNTDPFEITAVDLEDLEITVLRRTGSYDPNASGASKVVYMQNSKDKELYGITEIGDAVNNGSATMFGLTVQPGWQPMRSNGSSKPLIPDMITDFVEKFYDERGKTLDRIWMHSFQYASLCNQLEGKKEYTKVSSNEKRYADMGWKALSITSRHGDVAISTSKHCPKDKVMFTVNGQTKFISRPKWGWLTFDGKQYLREFTEGDVPKFKALYGGYGMHFAHPGMVGQIYGLEVPTI